VPRRTPEAASSSGTRNNIALVVSIISLVVAVVSLYESHRTHLLLDRAYVDALPPEQEEILPGIKPVMWVRLLNSGKTRAIQVISKTAFISGAKSDDQAFSHVNDIPEGMNGASVAILPPGRFAEQRTAPEESYDESKVNRIKAGITLIHVIGRVQYKDIFGDAHQTDFCFRYAPTMPRMEICHIGNVAD
jgi:hypothetical protein